MDVIHVDDEGVRRAAITMQQAAEQMNQAANLINETLTRFSVRFDEAIAQLDPPAREKEA